MRSMRSIRSMRGGFICDRDHDHDSDGGRYFEEIRGGEKTCDWDLALLQWMFLHFVKYIDILIPRYLGTLMP